MIKNVCVDLDGTLIRTDMLFESFLYHLKRDPLVVFKVFWILLFYGKYGVKEFLARDFVFDPSLLPFNAKVLDYLDDLRNNCPDAKFYLVSASHISIVEKISRHLSFFAGCFGSDRQLNLSSSVKAEMLDREFGSGNYVYLGNSADDIPVWKSSSEAICVDVSGSVLKTLTSQGIDHREISSRSGLLFPVLRALRVRQWPKNFLIFVPLITANLLFDLHAFFLLIIGFISFSLLSSFVYVVNDLLDLESDRSHYAKKKRPFACGDLPVFYGLLLLPLLLLSSFALSLAVGDVFISCLFVYLILTTLYSFKLKQFSMLDCMVLSFLYTFRMITGIMVLNVPISLWLITFSGFFFLSLALVKRMAEIRKKQDEAVPPCNGTGTDFSVQVSVKVKGRGYSVADYPILSQISVATGFISTLVFALYVNSSKVQMFPHPMIVYCCGPVLVFWFSYIFLKTHRGEMSDDPVMFAIKDRTSLVSGILFVGLFICGVIS